MYISITTTQGLHTRHMWRQVSSWYSQPKDPHLDAGEHGNAGIARIVAQVPNALYPLLSQPTRLRGELDRRPRRCRVLRHERRSSTQEVRLQMPSQQGRPQC